MTIQVHAESCHNSPNVSYSGNNGISSLTDYKKAAKKYFDKIKRDYNKAKNCSIYASIKNDLSKLRNKSNTYLSQSKKSGVSNRSKRGKAARCLKSIYSKMISLGKKAVEFEAQTADAGTNQDYQITSLFKFDQYCDAPKTSKDNSNGSSTGTSKPRGSTTGTSKPNNSSSSTNVKYPKCPKTADLTPKTMRMWNAKTLKATLHRFDKKTKSCYYKINGKGSYRLYTLKPNAIRQRR